MTQKNKRIDAEVAVKVITDWLEGKPDYQWAKPAAWVIYKLINDSDEDCLIDYSKAVNILNEAAESKMGCGPINQGMTHFKDKWKRMYI
jgi:hypothetical protein